MSLLRRPCGRVVGAVFARWVRAGESLEKYIFLMRFILVKIHTFSVFLIISVNRTSHHGYPSTKQPSPTTSLYPSPMTPISCPRASN